MGILADGAKLLEGDGVHLPPAFDVFAAPCAGARVPLIVLSLVVRVEVVVFVGLLRDGALVGNEREPPAIEERIPVGTEESTAVGVN